MDGKRTFGGLKSPDIKNRLSQPNKLATLMIINHGGFFFKTKKKIY